MAREVIEYGAGMEPDGIGYRFGFEPPHDFVVIAWDTRTDVSLEERFPPTWRPVFGPDIADVQTAEEIVERLIKELRALRESERS